MNKQNLITHDLNSMTIFQRSEDGYMNATADRFWKSRVRKASDRLARVADRMGSAA